MDPALAAAPPATGSDRLLRSALKLNAAFSAACGLAALAFAAPLAAALGIREEVILHVQGVGLVGFSAALLWLASRPAIRPALAMAVVVLDVLWVLTTPLPLVLSGWLTGPGAGTMVVLSAIVLGFAAAQYAGVRQLGAARA